MRYTCVANIIYCMRFVAYNVNYWCVACTTTAAAVDTLVENSRFLCLLAAIVK